jgi:hypothetical protein
MTLTPTPQAIPAFGFSHVARPAMTLKLGVVLGIGESNECCAIAKRCRANASVFALIHM